MSYTRCWLEHYCSYSFSPFRRPPQLAAFSLLGIGLKGETPRYSFGLGEDVAVAYPIARDFAPISTQSSRQPLLRRYIQATTFVLPIRWMSKREGQMFAGGRWLGFDVGDWSILAAGLALVGLLPMLF